MPIDNGNNGLAKLVRLPRRATKPLVAALAGVSALALISVAPTVPVQAQLTGPAAETLGRAPLSFADIVERVKPAVVSINVINGEPQVARNDDDDDGDDKPRLPDGFPNLPEDHPLYEFFKNLPREFRMPSPGPRMMPRPRQATGSGFVISEDGYVVTNNHVIDDASKVTVSFEEQEKYEADVVGTDPRTDLALLKIKADGKKFPYVKFASAHPRVGDWVLAVGNPFGLGGTVTAGIVSALARDIGSGPYDFMQIDAAVNRGNSGGPTFNLNGEVVGVNTAIYSPSGGNVGIAFAVPADVASQVVAELKEHGTVRRGWLGVRIQTIDEDVAASLGLKEPKGALVNDVTPNGPAANAGIKSQDAILAVNGERINDSRELARKIAEYNPDTEVDVKILRNNQEMTVKVKLGTFPGSQEEIARLERGGPAPSEMGSLGLTLSPAPAGKDGETEGVKITGVDSKSDAAAKGLKSGDIILEVNSRTVTSPSDVEAAVKEAKKLGRKAVLLTVRSGDQKRVVAVQMKS